MTCEVYEDLVAAHVDGVLSATELQEAECHIASCPRCHPLFTEQKQFRTAFATRPLIFSVPHSVEQRLLQRLRAETSIRIPRRERLATFWWRPRPLIGVATASLLLVLLLSYFFSSKQQQPFFAQAIDSYRLLVDQQQSLTYATADPRQLGTAFNLSGQLNFVTQVANLQPAGYQLRGGRINHLFDQPTAVSVYDGTDDHVVCLRLGGKLPTMPSGAEFIHNHYVYAHDGYTVVYTQFRQHYCVFISRLSKDAFLRRLALTPGD
jgi:anti-sigma factor RsiW